MIGDELVISGLGLVTPFTCSAGALDKMARDACPQAGDDWFDADAHLGAYGHKNLMPACQYAVAAAQLAVTDALLAAEPFAEHRVGVAIGSNFGNHPTLADMDAVVRAKGSQGIRPLQSPNFALNLAASNLSIWHGFKAFNVTLTNPIVAGVQAMGMALRHIRDGRADAVLAGALEDRSTGRAAAVLGLAASDAGACVALVERAGTATRRGRTPHAVVAAYGSTFIAPAKGVDDRRKALSAFLARTLGEHPRARTVVYAALSYSTEFALSMDALAHEWLASRLEVQRSTPLGSEGSFMSVSPMLLIASLAASYGEGIVLAASPFGEVAVFELRKP